MIERGNNKRDIKPLNYNYSQERLGLNRSKLAQEESNDCVVKAIASAAKISYEASHAFTGDYLMRSNGKGVCIKLFLPNITKSPMKIGGQKVIFEELHKSRILNRYKVKGKIYLRKKTVKSFIQDNIKGSFVLTVSGHALAVVDGVLIDNIGEEYRMTRKVLGAIEVRSSSINKQLTLF